MLSNFFDWYVPRFAQFANHAAELGVRHQESRSEEISFGLLDSVAEAVIMVYGCLWVGHSRPLFAAFWGMIADLG